MSSAKAGKIAALIVVGYLIVQLLGLKTMGLTDDDDFYIPAGIEYARWLGQVASFDGAAFTKAGIDRAFSPNHEHPPFAKYVFGICHFAFSKLLGPTDSARVGTVLFSTLSAALLFVLAIFHLGPRRGLFAGTVAVLLLLTLPRFYFHSHAATLDVPVAAMYLLAATLALLAERRGWAAWATGIAFGLATATKLNGPFMIVPYLVFALLVRRGLGRGEAPPRRGLVSLPQLPTALLSMVLIGPVVFFAIWPWMWFDVADRVVQYVSFHFNHYGIYFLYFGTLYDKNPFAPWHAPLTMAAITIPLATSGLALVGFGLGRTAMWSRIRRPGAYSEGYKREGDLLLTCVLNAAVSILVVSFSGGPKYGGAKLFMPFYPFFCLLAGYGAMRLYEVAQEGLQRRWVPVAATGLAVVASLSLQLRFGGYALSEYNGAVGGLRGATAVGFERQYYDIAFRDLVAWLNANAPKDARVHFLPNNWEYVRTYKWYRTAGELRSDIQVTQSPGPAQWIILTHERRFARYGNDLIGLRNKPVLMEKVVDGVPIWSVVQAR